jgi:hypothetical protein
MADVKIRINTDVENIGMPVADTLQKIADETESYCAYLHGDPTKIEQHYLQLLTETVSLLEIIMKLRYTTNI